MQEFFKLTKSLSESIDKSLSKLKFDQLKTELAKMEASTLAQDFWSNRAEASQVNQQINKLKNRLEPWQKLKNRITELLELAKLEDVSLLEELKKQYEDIKSEYQYLQHELLFSGAYDGYDSMLSIYAGAGGTDAQDWAEMLLRMYSRWSEEKKGFSIKLLDTTPGEEAGIKSVHLDISGPLSYGWLKGEHGVHRLVRLSPFNADNLRQTSFAKVEVLPKIEKPQELVLDDKDIKIDMFRSGGKGGQSVNTTDSAVRVTHLPTGISVVIQNERSQLQNKETALTIIRSRLAQMQLEQHKEKIEELKGPNEQAAWGNQIRSYVLHPYNMVKDLRTKYETSDTQAVLDGDLDNFMMSFLEWSSAHN